MKKICVTKKEIETILKIMEENQVEGSVDLLYNNSSGIGSTLDIEFDFELNGRYVIVRTNVTNSDSW